MADLVLETKNLTKRYGDFVALDDLSMRVERGQILGFIGPNGQGRLRRSKFSSVYPVPRQGPLSSQE